MKRLLTSVVVLSAIFLGTAFVTPRAAAQALDPPATFDPYPCGGPGSICNIVSRHKSDGSVDFDHVTTVSYGDPDFDAFHNILSSGISEIRCEAVLGDPTVGRNKPCQVQTVLLPKATGWQPCAYGTVCPVTVAANNYRVARFGTGNRWVYLLVASAYRCDVADFNGMRFDPNVGVAKSCQTSTNEISPSPGSIWRPCAGGTGAECRFPASGTYLVRYGANNAWFYRLMTGSKASCDTSTFNGDPVVGGNKRCDLLEIGQIAKIVGRWEPVGMCANCGSIEYTVSVGVEQGKTRERESAWSAEFSTTVSSSSGVLTDGVAKTQASTTFTVGASGRDLLAESFTKSENHELKMSCDKGALWQWVTTVENRCFPGGKSRSDCFTAARSKMFQCIAQTQPPGTQPIEQLR